MRFAVLFLAGAFFAVVLVAVAFAGAFLAVLFLATVFLAVAFFAGLFFAVLFFAVDLAVSEADLPTDDAALAVCLGSFLAPETTALRSAPALNFGTAVFFALIRSPVRGLRTMRASRIRFSKEPKPVMATFSPLASCRVMVSSTDSSA